MKFAHFFIHRPIFAIVLSLVLLILGGISYTQLPVASYPEIAPPTVVVTAVYPGANPQTLADTVATPIEQQVNGVENMLYMNSQSASDGTMTLTITFKLGTNLDVAQVLVQNRVAIATPQLPQDVRNIGVTVQKQSPNIMLVVNLLSDGDKYDTLYMANYAVLQIQEVIKRIEGVGNVQIFGASEYSMRLWLDPDKTVLARVDRQRCHHRRAGAERAGRRRHARRGARSPGHGFPAHRQHQGPPDGPEGVREASSSSAAATASSCASATWATRNSARRPTSTAPT